MSHTILTSHVLYRGFQTGAVLGHSLKLARSLFTKSGKLSGEPILASTLRSAGIGAVAGTALMVPGLYMRMRGREEIEWKDRSWRLLEHEGQKAVDDCSIVGTAVGSVVGARQLVSHEAARVKALKVIGGAGVGSIAGVVVYLGWYYGVMRGEHLNKRLVVQTRLSTYSGGSILLFATSSKVNSILQFCILLTCDLKLFVTSPQLDEAGVHSHKHHGLSQHTNLCCAYLPRSFK